MPQALDVNWEAVRTVAVAVGVREAARQFGISEDAALQRSVREGWLKQLRDAERIKTERLERAAKERGMSSAVIKPAQALGNALAAIGQKTRLSLAKGTHKAAKHIAKLPGAEIVSEAQNVASIAKTAALVHGWSETGPNVSLRLDVVAAASQPQPVQGRVINSTDAPSDAALIQETGEL